MSKVYSNIRLFSQIIGRATACLIAFFIFTAAASAATYTVDTTDSDAALTACTAEAVDCSLRGAIARANATPDNDSINFALPAGRNTIYTDGELTINNAGALTITNSTGASNLRISADYSSRVFLVKSGANLILNGVSVVEGQTGGFGGGILIMGTATITNSTISENEAYGGGGIFNFNTFSTLSLSNSTVSGNTATTTGPGGGGGGIANDGTATITNSTVSGNEVTIYDGGGIFNEAALTIINSTVSGNTARTGGGIYNSAAGRLTLTSVTVAFNSAVGGDGGGVKNFRGTANLRNTIVGQNAAASASADFEGAIASTSSFNLIGSGTGMTGIANGSGGNQVGVDPKLDPTLALNGGGTPNHALLPDSTAIDRGNDTGTTDQRGFFRPIDLPNYANATGGNAADIGAFEAQTTPPALPRTVDTNADDAALTACTPAPNDCSLRGAVSAANASAFPDSINFAAGITNITLTSEIRINNAGSLTIIGYGTTIDGGAGTSGIIQVVNAAVVRIEGLTLSGGNGFGAAVYVEYSQVILESVVVKDNTGDGRSGAIAFLGGENNRIVNSTIFNNSGFPNCAAIYASEGSFTISNSTISGNSTTASGSGTGAVCVEDGSRATIRSTTIAGNTSNGVGSRGGGGIYVANGGKANLGNTIVAGNTTVNRGPDLYRADSTATFETSYGNVIGDNSGNSAAPNTTAFPTGNPNSTRDKVGTAGATINPQLAPLADNGGRTPTRALLANSPAIDNGSNSLVNAFGPTEDQRGAARIIDGNGDGTATVDSGAFETALGTTAASVSVSGRVTTQTGRGIRNVVVTMTDMQGNTRMAKTSSFGYYRFTDVAAGETVILSAKGKRFEFAQPTQVLNLTEDADGINFVAY